MYRFLQTHGKKLMAVFSAFLMIAFALPSASKYSSGFRDAAVGKIYDGDKVRSSEVYDARRSWEALKTIPRRDGQGSQATILPREIAQAIEQRPLLYVLLQKEAQKMGVAVG